MVEMGGEFWCSLTCVFPHKEVKIRPFLLTDTPSYPIAFCYDRAVLDKRESTVVSSKSTAEPSQVARNESTADRAKTRLESNLPSRSNTSLVNVTVKREFGILIVQRDNTLSTLRGSGWRIERR